MEYGQGKDPNALLRKTRKYGSGWESVGQFIGGAITAGFGAKNGDADKTMQGLQLIGSSVNNFSNQVISNKKMTGKLDLTQPLMQPVTQLIPTNLQNNQKHPTAGDLTSTSLDMGAGYNPLSETFHDGLGNIYMDQRPTFDLQAAQEPILNLNPNLTSSKQVPMSLIGNKLNYFTYSI